MWPLSVGVCSGSLSMLVCPANSINHGRGRMIQSTRGRALLDTSETTASVNTSTPTHAHSCSPVFMRTFRGLLYCRVLDPNPNPDVGSYLA